MDSFADLVAWICAHLDLNLSAEVALRAYA